VNRKRDQQEHTQQGGYQQQDIQPGGYQQGYGYGYQPTNGMVYMFFCNSEDTRYCLLSYIAYACCTLVVHRPLTTVLHLVLFCAMRSRSCIKGKECFHVTINIHITANVAVTLTPGLYHTASVTVILTPGLYHTAGFAVTLTPGLYHTASVAVTLTPGLYHSHAFQILPSDRRYYTL
jgi:hypothetical protein